MSELTDAAPSEGDDQVQELDLQAVTPEDVGDLLDRLTLRTVRLVRWHGDTPVGASGEVAVVEEQLEPPRIKVVPDEVSLWFEHRVRCKDQQGEELATIATGVVVDFDLSAGDPPNSGVVACLADTNGVFFAWPYIREAVQSMSVRLGLVPIILGVLRRDEDAYARREDPSTD